MVISLPLRLTYGGIVIKKVNTSERSGSTMTVKELRDTLSHYPDDMPVVATWEGVVAGITIDNFSYKYDERYMPEMHLEIDVENYG